MEIKISIVYQFNLKIQREVIFIHEKEVGKVFPIFFSTYKFFLCSVILIHIKKTTYTKNFAFTNYLDENIKHMYISYLTMYIYFQNQYSH